MSLPIYSNYRNSGTQWLGDIPAHWNTARLKHACSVMPSNVDKKAYDDETPIVLCNYTDVYYNDKITNAIEFMPATASGEQISRFTLRGGDTLITKDSETANDIAISAYVPEDMPGVVCGYHLAVVRPKYAQNGLYIKRLFDSHYLKACFAVAANGLTRVGLSQYALDNVVIPLPPPNEQSAISVFLELETRKIDALIAEQKKLLELLAEKRQATISHAVTRGLNPDVPMKDSGVEWLGMVPRHWKITRIKSIAKLISKGTTPTTIGRNFADKGVRFLKAENIFGGSVIEEPKNYIDEDTHILLRRSNLAAWDILVVIAGATTGKSAVLEEAMLPCNTNQAVSFIRPVDINLSTSIHNWLSTSHVQKRIRLTSVQSAQPNLSMEDLGNLYIPLAPSADEREKISAYIDVENNKIDALEAETEHAIRLLQERRSALISAAVTGKIDVREHPSALADAA